MIKFKLLILLVFCLTQCQVKTEKKKLPVLGRPQIVEKIIDGRVKVDSIPHRIADFSFYNQDSVLINNDSLKEKIYVADFFFTSCPTICPSMKKQMLRVYDKFLNEPTLMIVSHTIDPKHDNVQVLKDFSEALGVDSNKWHFLTGDQKNIYQLGEKSYMLVAGEEKSAPGGYIHSGAFILIDNQRRVRGVYDGTEPEQVDILLEEIDLLLDEVKNNF